MWQNLTYSAFTEADEKAGALITSVSWWRLRSTRTGVMELLLRREEYSSSAEFLALVSCSWTVLGNPCALDTTLEQEARIWSLRPRTMERVCHSSCCVMERQSRQVVVISIFNIKRFVFLNQAQCWGRCGGVFSCPHCSGLWNVAFVLYKLGVWQ